MLEPEQRPSSNDIHDNNYLRLGLNRWLQIFITQSFYLFLVRPTSNNNDEQQQLMSPSVNSVEIVTSENAMRERSLAGLVTFYKKLPQRHIPDRVTWYILKMKFRFSSFRYLFYLVFLHFLFFRDLILRVMLKIVRLSLQDRPPPNTNHLYIENIIKVCLRKIYI